MPPQITHLYWILLLFYFFFLLKPSNYKMRLVVTSRSSRDGTRREPSPQFSKQRSNTYRTSTVRAYTDAERFDIIREKVIMTTLETRKQVFARLFLLEIFSNLMWGACVGEWPWPCWGGHHMGTFCSPPPSCCRQNVCHSFTDVTGIISKPYHINKMKRERVKGELDTQTSSFLRL